MSSIVGFESPDPNRVIPAQYITENTMPSKTAVFKVEKKSRFIGGYFR